MGLFTRKPNRALQAELAKHASRTRNLFGYALLHKRAMPPIGMEDAALDLTIQENRDAIRGELVRLILEYQLIGCTEAEIGGMRLVPLAMRHPKPLIEDAALCSALAMNSTNFITRIHYEQYPTYRPLYEMINSLAKLCSAGTAQTIGPELPTEIVKTWPYFSHLFGQAKRSTTWSWPAV